MVTYCASTDMDNMFSNAASVAKNLLTDVLHDDVVFEKILARVELGLRRYAVPKKQSPTKGYAHQLTHPLHCGAAI